MLVAERTGKRHVGWLGFSIMLESNDVVNFMRRQNVGLGNQTIFTAPPGALINKPA
jgi:hypothetical protein